jgi:hypothetical protein
MKLTNVNGSLIQEATIEAVKCGTVSLDNSEFALAQVRITDNGWICRASRGRHGEMYE